MTYANGDKMFAKYNSIGQMVDEKWQNSTGTDIAHYKYVYDGKGNIVRSIDFLGKKEYNYEYEDGRIVRATESNITVTNEIVTSKVIVNTIKYYLADRFVFKHKAGPVTYLWGIKAGLSGATIVSYDKEERHILRQEGRETLPLTAKSPERGKRREEKLAEGLAVHLDFTMINTIRINTA